jgi:biotin carboxyl carrier protein
MLESMKMEIAIKAPVDGEVLEIRCVEGRPVAAGDPICVLQPSAR